MTVGIYRHNNNYYHRGYVGYGNHGNTTIIHNTNNFNNYNSNRNNSNTVTHYNQNGNYKRGNGATTSPSNGAGA